MQQFGINLKNAEMSFNLITDVMQQFFDPNISRYP